MITKPLGVTVGAVLLAMITGCASDDMRERRARDEQSPTPATQSPPPPPTQSQGLEQAERRPGLPPGQSPDMPSPGTASSPSPSTLPDTSPPAATGPLTARGQLTAVEGEVLRVNGRTFEYSESYLIRDRSGQERLVYVTLETRMQSRPEIGDRIMAEVAHDGRAASVRTLSADSGILAGTTAEQTLPDKTRGTIPAGSTAGQRAVTGDLLRMEGEYFVIRDGTGREVRLQVDKNTKMEDAVQVGDKIEAQVTGPDHAEVVRKAMGSGSIR